MAFTQQHQEAALDCFLQEGSKKEKMKEFRFNLTFRPHTELTLTKHGGPFVYKLAIIEAELG